MALFTTDQVLVPTDFSGAANRVLEDTLAFVADAGQVHVLHVLPNLNPGEPGVMWKTIDNRSRTDHVYQEFQKRYSGPLYERVQFQVAIGDPSNQIAHYAQVHAINLIVIPSHGRKGISHFLLGSVAERVSRCAPCPVLIVRR
ncbi:universal stress protein [Prochlorothrix hollandica]|uniref:Universal stress protein UspA n=1 Tax=Prochlorothrix hollandica PCC 9006 = CALU 1027 TaxID=317619 RepID=A0A0M2PXU4_PROHO|nr:universal stress protein [Prochlorothrix hollandica]KKJ00995.1 universal stress protein UspA [Prochlorothrix hollandica PCC 9006 = CALU 1027]